MTTLPLEDQLKRLRLSGILQTYQPRLEQARAHAFAYEEWLSLLLQDEIQRRDAQALAKRLTKAHFEQEKTFEGYDFNRYPVKVQQTIRSLMVGQYLEEQQHLLIMGPTGTGKTHLAQALGHQACRQGKKVRFIRANILFRELLASRADHTWEQQFKKLLHPELLIIDDFGLKAFSSTQAEDIYELIAERHLKSSFVITSNRTVEGLLELFPDPVMGNAALDRIAHRAHHLILEGESYRKKTRPQIQI
jgi:DNA replication protein DnaC